MKQEFMLKIFIKCFLVMSILISCISYEEKPTSPTPIKNIEEHQQINGCLPPIYGNVFSYPIVADLENLSYPGINMFIQPSSPWQVESNLPEIPEITNWDQRNFGVIQTRSLKDYFEIWVNISKGLEEQAYLAVYRTDTKEWKIIPEHINSLIVDRNNSLWGGYFGYYGYAYENHAASILNKYDEVANAFIPVKEIANLPPVITSEGSYYYSVSLLDRNGIFWIFVPTDGIYAFNPETKVINRNFELQGTFRDVKIDSNGNIYILFNNTYFLDNKQYLNYLLKSYATESRDIGEIALSYRLEPYPTPLTLLIDSQNRVWLDNIAYLADGNLYQIQRSSFFISPITQGYSDYRYKRADVLLESSDGRIWFKHQNGMIWLDPEKGEWCWFTTYQSNIVEDSDRNLWMIADNKLYKLPLGEQ